MKISSIFTELLDIAKSLELRSVNELYHQWMKFNVTMNWVVEYLVYKCNQ